MADERTQTAKKSKEFVNRVKKVFRHGSQSTPQRQDIARIRAKYTHFRILVIGRANAGKTTLLKRVCNTREDPVYSRVSYQLCLISLYHFFSDRLTQPTRCQLRDLCEFL